MGGELFHERRRWPRKPVNAPGFVRGAGGRPVDCTILNISANGACVSAPDIALPKYFILRAASLLLEQVCEVVWVTGYTAGVRFVAPEAPTTRH